MTTTTTKTTTSKSENVFSKVWMISLILDAPCLYAVHTYNAMIHDDPNNKEGYEYPKYSDMWIMVLSAIITQIVEYSLTRLFQPTFAMICKEQKDKTRKQFYSHKSARTAYQALYFLFVTIYGYIVLNEMNMIPWQLFGTGSSTGLNNNDNSDNKQYVSIVEAVDNCMSDRPYQKIPRSILIYALITLGYHFGDTISHAFFKERKSDYYEMLLHHSVTVVLYFGTIMTNHVPTGALIEYLHAMADIFGSASKSMSGTRYPGITAGIFVITMILWFWSRMFVFGQVILRLHQITDNTSVYFKISIIFLCTLLMLHIYWFNIFIKMITKYKKDGTAEDIQNRRVDSNTTRKKDK